MRIPESPVKYGVFALFFLLLSVMVSGVEALLVQTLSISHILNLESFEKTVTASLVSIDFLTPLSLALLSRRAYLVFLAGQTAVSAVILHYGSFFYNTLTLSTIYHSMQGLSFLGGSVLVFIKADILFLLALAFGAEVFLLWLSSVPHEAMPRVWSMRGVAAVSCLMALSVTVFWGHGRAGILSLWTDDGPHRTALDRRSQEGSRESVRHLGYLATWAGEWLSGLYRDTSLIYAEKRCEDPQKRFLETHAGGEGTWCGFPLPPASRPMVMIQVESLDFAALAMDVNQRPVMPFLRSLLPESLVIKAFAPHKVGSSNADYEMLNGRVADQNVMYYSYIRDYPDSVAHALAESRPATFHGLEGELFHLRDAYALMGFKETFFKEELVEEGYPVSGLAMEHVADEYVLDAAARYLEEGRGDAVFVVTMSSHIPFMDHLPQFGLRGGLFARYVASLNYVDACLADFYDRLSDGALLALWGDHGSEVSYPSGWRKNGPYVPFLVNVKGDGAWLSGAKRDGEDRTFTLCELSYFLRRMAERSGD